MRKPKTKYKKATSLSQTAMKTARILFTVLAGVIIVLVAFFIIKDGWNKFAAWFVGKWACLAAIIIVVVVTLGLWLYKVIETLTKVSEDEN